MRGGSGWWCIFSGMSEISVDRPFLDGRPFTLSEAARVGVSEKMLRRLVASGVVRSLCRGLYVDTSTPDSLSLRAEAVAKVVAPDTVVCRTSAAWLYGIDCLSPDQADAPLCLETLRPPKSRSGRLAVTSGHSQTLLPGDVIELHGLRVTSPLATAVHLARHLRRPFALSALDAMARADLIDEPELCAAIDRYPHHPGIRQARELARLIDARSESPGESWLRLRLLDAGFTDVVPQVEVMTGERLRRIDLGFPKRPRSSDGLRLGLEYDSDEWHGTREQRVIDEDRVDELRRVGWLILPVRRWQLWGPTAELELAVGEFLEFEPWLPRRW